MHLSLERREKMTLPDCTIVQLPEQQMNPQQKRKGIKSRNNVWRRGNIYAINLLDCVSPMPKIHLDCWSFELEFR
ncbi:hypothetical protein WI73_03550 [Burkholderia ubonensis]|nr:hypothetical protein WI73_03550 [Burkholderia ubonensis]